MSGLFFIGTCSHCRRHAEIEIKKLGQTIDCENCHQTFVAIDPHSQSAALDDPLKYWIRFTDHVHSQPDGDAVPGKDISRTPR